MKTLIILLAVLACTLAMDTMVNLASKEPRVLNAMFRDFQHAEGRHYANAQEARMRLKNFRKFVTEMAQANDEPDGVEYGVTIFADLTEAEAQDHYGFANRTYIEAAEKEEVEPETEEEEGPELEKRSWWMDDVVADHSFRYDGLKDQTSCRSCWAFGTTAVLEAWAHKQNWKKVRFSEQQVLDCSGSGNTCTGGWHYEALRAVMNNNHLASESDYRYQNRRSTCRRSSYRNALNFRITGVYKATSESQIETKLYTAPLAVALDYRNIKIRGYYRGIWSDTNCNYYPTHVMTLTGYASNYWKLRNSWGSHWGEGGYMKITRSVQNVCLIADYAYYITAVGNGEEELE